MNTKRNQKNNLHSKVKLTANILFSGIGCQERGFRDSGLFDVEVLNTSDIDKEAVVSYAAVHCGLTKEMIENYPNYPTKDEMVKHLSAINLGYVPEKNQEYDWVKLAKRKGFELEKYWLACKLTNNLGDISKIEKLPYADLWTCSFPCTDVSCAGKMKGLNPDSSTRSSLLWENIRLLNIAKEEDALPKYIMFENVKNLVSKKFINDFNNLIEVLDELGFNSYWEVINGKNCGVPQNRERVFVISIRKDIDTKQFTFPKPFDNGLRLKDILEPEVAEKYYLSERALAKFKFYNEPKGEEIKVAGSVNPDKEVQDRVRVLDPTGVSQSLGATDYKDPVKIATGIDKSCNNTSVIEYANCITAREDRGVSNRKSEGTAILEQVGQIYGTDREPNPQAGRIYNKECLSPTLRSTDYKDPVKIVTNNSQRLKETHSLNRIGNIYGEDKGTGYAGNVWDDNQLYPALTTMQGGNRQPMIMKVEQVSNEGSQAGMVYSPDGISQTLCAGTHGYAMGNILEEPQEDLHKPVRLGHFLYPNSNKPHQSNVFYDKNAISPTLDTCTGGNRQTKILEYGFRIRKLTPRECWELMGFEFDDCDKAASVGITDTHLYKQAGNGIITNCCELLAEHLYKAQYDNTFECFDENFTRPRVE